MVVDEEREERKKTKFPASFPFIHSDGANTLLQTQTYTIHQSTQEENDNFLQ